MIFTRGEYIQVVDANQDNYLEECLKIKSVLAEFEEMENNSASEYIPEVTDDNSNCPVAILGTREYIFSENIGILGDIAAGKEQTFGTLFSRTLAEIGGKLASLWTPRLFEFDIYDYKKWNFESSERVALERGHLRRNDSF